MNVRFVTLRERIESDLITTFIQNSNQMVIYLFGNFEMNFA